MMKNRYINPSNCYPCSQRPRSPMFLFGDTKNAAGEDLAERWHEPSVQKTRRFTLWAIYKSLSCQLVILPKILLGKRSDKNHGAWIFSIVIKTPATNIEVLGFDPYFQLLPKEDPGSQEGPEFWLMRDTYLNLQLLALTLTQFHPPGAFEKLTIHGIALCVPHPSPFLLNIFFNYEHF